MKKLHILLFALIALTCSYVFFPNPADNVMARMDLIYSIVYRDSLNIDGYRENTIDAARKDGHYYYSGGPGTVFPGAAILYAYKTLSGDNNPNPYNSVPLRIITILLVSLPAAALAVMLFAFLGYFTAAVRDRLALTLAFSFGTLAFPYSTLFYTYLPALALCFGAFLIAERFRRKDAFPNWAVFVSGFMLAYAFICSFDCIMITAPMAAYIFFSLKDKNKIVFFLLGAIPPAVALLVYNRACFGSLLTVGIFHMNQPEWAITGNRFARRLLSPQPIKILTTAALPGQGIFWLSPFLLFSIPGFAAMFRDKDLRARAALFLAVAALYLLANSAFPVAWQGGFAVRPRYMTPAMIFLAVPAFFQLRRSGVFGRYLFFTLTAVSIFHFFTFVFTDPHVPESISNSVYAYCLPLFIEGYTTQNVGNALGLHGPASTLPLFAIAAVLIFDMIKSEKRDNAAAGRFSATALIASVTVGVLFVAVSFRLSDYSARTAAVNRGVACLRNHVYQSAAAEFSRALESPDERGFDTLLFYRGTAFEKSGDYAGALSDYESALRINPLRTDARIAAERIAEMIIDGNSAERNPQNPAMDNSRK
ncbi:MAG: tetratricopeptide repeat protein [bacterium]